MLGQQMRQQPFFLFRLDTLIGRFQTKRALTIFLQLGDEHRWHQVSVVGGTVRHIRDIELLLCRQQSF